MLPANGNLKKMWRYIMEISFLFEYPFDMFR